MLKKFLNLVRGLFWGSSNIWRPLLVLPLWQKSLIRIQNKPVLYNDWISKGILQVKHLMDDSCNLLSLTAFQNKYGIKVQPLTFFGITSAVNCLHRSITRTHKKYKSILSKLLTCNTQKPSRLAYQKIVSKKVNIQFHVKKNGRRIHLQTLMTVLIGQQLIKYPLNVPRALNLSISISNFCTDTYISATISFLQKIGIKDKDKINTSFVKKKERPLVNTPFWGMWKKQARTFWNDVSTWIQSCQVPLQNNHLSMKTALGLKPDSSENKLQINFCCLTSKYYIWLCHSKEQVLTVGNYLQFLKKFIKWKRTPQQQRQNGNPYNLNPKSPNTQLYISYFTLWNNLDNIFLAALPPFLLFSFIVQ